MSFTEILARSLEGSLGQGQLALALLVCALGGLLTAFTPCVYPLIPITIRYFGGMQDSGRRRVVARALTYVAGMILLYAALGTAFASLNLVFGSFLSSPLVSLAIALFCVAMGASMLGLFSLQLPVGLSTRLATLGGQGLFGAFVMGLVSGLIAAPCTGPVLAVILTLIASSGQLSLGFGLMVAFGLGLGVPFLVLALSSGALARLPKSGTWMELVKAVLATAMFVVAVYFAQIGWPGLRELFAGVPAASAVAAASAVLGVVALLAHLRLPARLRPALWKGLGIVALTLGATVAMLGGAHERETAAAAGVPLITWQSEHDGAMARARAEGRPVMIDFTAEWCAACKELDRETYVDARVRAEATRFVSLKIDATEIDEGVQKLFDRYGVLGLPTVIFIDSAGRVMSKPRVTGFVEPERFVALMREVR